MSKEKALRHCWVVESRQPYGWDAESTFWSRRTARGEIRRLKLQREFSKWKFRVRKYVPARVPGERLATLGSFTKVLKEVYDSDYFNKYETEKTCLAGK